MCSLSSSLLRMGRLKLKIKRVETIDTDSICERCAKRMSRILIQEALSNEEKQKAKVKELEVRLKKLEADCRGNQAKDLKNQSNDLAVEKQEDSLPTTSEDRKAQTALPKKHVKKRGLLDEILKLRDGLTLTERKKLAKRIDTERDKAKQLEQDRKEIEKGAYQAIKESLRKKLASEVDVERTKAEQLEQNRKEIVHNFVEPRNDLFANNVGQHLASILGLPMSMEDATPFNMVEKDKMTIQIGKVTTPLFPKPRFLATDQAEKHAAKP